MRKGGEDMSKEKKVLKEDNQEETIVTKQDYYMFGKIRHIVAEGSCNTLRASRVAIVIKDKHYQQLKELYKLSKEDIDLIIEKVTPHLDL